MARSVHCLPPRRPDAEWGLRPRLEILLSADCAERCSVNRRDFQPLPARGPASPCGRVGERLRSSAHVGVRRGEVRSDLVVRPFHQPAHASTSTLVLRAAAAHQRLVPRPQYRPPVLRHRMQPLRSSVVLQDISPRARICRRKCVNTRPKDCVCPGKWYDCSIL